MVRPLTNIMSILHDCRQATDYDGSEVESRRVKVFANKYYRKVDDERTAIKMAFNQWKVEPGKHYYYYYYYYYYHHHHHHLAPLGTSIRQFALTIKLYPFLAPNHIRNYGTGCGWDTDECQLPYRLGGCAGSGAVPLHITFHEEVYANG